MADPIRVLIVDDHQVIAEGMSVLVSGQPDLRVVGVAHTAAEGSRLAAETHPDVVLLDHHLPDRSGVEITADLKNLSPGAAIVILTSDDDDAVLVRAFASGAAGYLLKTRAASQVVDAIRTAATGEMLISAPTLARVLEHQKARAIDDARLATVLTERELEVLVLIARGLETRAIGEQLGLTVATVRTYVQVILRKLDAHSRLQAVMRARERGLL